MRTSGEDLHDDAVEALLDASRRAGLHVVPAEGDSGADVVIEGPTSLVQVEVRAMSVGDGARVAALTNRGRKTKTGGARSRDRMMVVVADQLSDEARSMIRESDGWGYLDRRGALWLKGPGLLVNDTSLSSLDRRRPGPDGPIRGRVGLGVALYLLMHPHHARASVRAIAVAVEASPSTVHDALSRLRDHALVEADGSPMVPDLFDTLSGLWRPGRVPVLRQPSPADENLGLGFGADGDVDGPLGHGWAVGGDVGAAAWGAPIVVGLGAPPDFYVPTQVLLGRAVRQLGTSTYEARSATLAVAPSPLVTGTRRTVESSIALWMHWPAVHPVVVALDLAQDLARGREILSEWTPDGAIRVW